MFTNATVPSGFDCHEIDFPVFLTVLVLLHYAGCDLPCEENKK